jgi:16S rRNA G966 N2-methylase RsmD
MNPATQHFILAHANDDPVELLLRKNIPPEVDIKFAAQQVEGRQRAREKLPTLALHNDFIFPQKLSLEQSSSEFTAKYKSQLFYNQNVIDVTGGLGVDAFYIAQCAKSVAYVEKNTELCKVAQHNFSALGAKNITVHCGDGIQLLKEGTQHFDAIYLDPARRDSNQNRVVSLADCEPNVPEHLDFFLSKADTLVLKASPMLDITQAVRELQCVCEVHVVAVKNECKELLFVCRKGIAQPCIRCVDVLSAQSFEYTQGEENQAVAQYADSPKRYLYEPNVALLKAGAFKLPCSRFGVEKLHPDTHLYTSDILAPDFFGRIFEVQQTFSLSGAELKKYLPEMQANLAVRNFPHTVADIRKKYKIKDGGNSYLFAATLYGGERRLIKTVKVSR